MYEGQIFIYEYSSLQSYYSACATKTHYLPPYTTISHSTISTIRGQWGTKGIHNYPNINNIATAINTPCLTYHNHLVSFIDFTPQGTVKYNNITPPVM